MKRTAGATIICLVTALVLAACSSSSSSKSPNAVKSGSESSAAKLTGSPIKIMTIASLSTGATAVPTVPDGAMAAVKAINASGGINGHPLVYTSCDDLDDPATAANCARTAVADGDIAVVGSDTQQGASYLPILAAAHIPAVGIESVDAADFTSPSSFPLQGGAGPTLAEDARVLAQEGAKHIAAARVDIAAGAAIPVLADQGLPAGQKVRDVPIPAAAPDMAPYVAAAASGGTDGVIVVLGPGEDTNFLSALFQQDPTMKVAFVSGVDEETVVQTLGSAGNGMLIAESFSPYARNATTSEFKSQMAAVGHSSEASLFTEDTWASLQLVADTARHLTRLTANALYGALSTDSDTVTGITPAINFTKGGVGGLPRVFNSCEFVSKVTNGSEIPLNGQFINPYTGAQCPAP